MTGLRSEVAIVGMACIFPGAPDLLAYWQNIISKFNAITDPPEDWEGLTFYDPHSTDDGQLYCKRGGYLRNISFSPADYGVMPKSVDGASPDHFLALELTRGALADAGYLDRPFDRKRTEVIIGRGIYINRAATNLLQHALMIDQTLRLLKELHPEYTEEELRWLKQQLKASLPPLNAEVAPGLVPNILTGRIANRFDLMGANYTVDAACASSLIAVERGIQDLLTKNCDMALVGGANVEASAPSLMLFCQLKALSRRGQIRPFDKDADGTLLGEGIGMVVLKRREDAERDRDRIYALIKSVGVSSDGRAMGLLAPRIEGEELAIRRAYEAAGISPTTVQLIEAHGTGTPVGDAVEIEALTRVFGTRRGERPWCALGAVKSMIGHLIPAAGIAGLIKVALALYHRVLPPTLNCDEPNPALKLEASPFYINTETRPWIHGSATPRRAGVNAFGFGGINAHAILDEYTGQRESEARTYQCLWPTEVFILQGNSRRELIQEGQKLVEFLSSARSLELKDLAYTLNTKLRPLTYRLAVVAVSLMELKEKLAYALQRLADPECARIKELSGIYFFEKPLSPHGKLAFLFPGEGSQYPNMLLDLCIHFPEVRAWFDLMDSAFLTQKRDYLPSQLVFPPAAGATEINGTTDFDRLWQMDAAVEAVFSANQALFSLLQQLDIRPQFVVGHSSGEYSALMASGAFQRDGNEQLVIASIQALNGIYQKLSADGKIPGAVLMAVGSADSKLVSSVARQFRDRLYLAISNCPHQVVFCGTQEAVDLAGEEFRNGGAICNILPFGRAYHTPLFEPVCDGLHEFFQNLRISPPRIETYSCATAQPYPPDPKEIGKLAAMQWARPVRFQETIEAMYDAGVRIFVEVGPKGNLTSFVDDILRGRSYLAIPADVAARSGITQLNHLVGLLAAQHVPLDPRCLYARRVPKDIPLEVSEVSMDANPKETSGREVKLNLRLPLLQLNRKELVALPPRSHAAERVTEGKGRLGAEEAPVTSLSQSAPHSLDVSSLWAAPASSVLSEPAASVGTIHPESVPAKVMRGYLATMERFLDAQQEIIQSFISSRRQTGNGMAQAAIPSGSAEGLIPSLTERPFIHGVTWVTPGRELVAVCELDSKEALFLQDHTLDKNHTLAGKISLTDDGMVGLPVMPLAMSMEVLAEAASLLRPHHCVVGMKNVRAFRWLVLEEDRLRLQLVAKQTEEANEVEVFMLEAESGSSTSQLPIIEGTVIFGDTYPLPRPSDPLRLQGERPSKLPAGQLYETTAMFHGPSFQLVTSIDRTGTDGAEAILVSRSGDSLFSSHGAPRFLIDPVVLDAMGQVVGYWVHDHFETSLHAFPFEVERLNLYSPALSPGQRVSCRLRVKSVDEGWVQSDIELFSPNGPLLCELINWKDRRMDLPRGFFDFLMCPQRALLSQTWARPLEQLPQPARLACCLLKRFPEEVVTAHGSVWLRVIAYMVLNQRERKLWRGLQESRKRSVEWLMGRIAAKDALRSFLQERYGMLLCPADIEIAGGDNGRPEVKGNWTAQMDRVPNVSIAHVDEVAVAIAGQEDRWRGIGVDIERLGRINKDFERVAFTRGEKDLLTGLEGMEREEWSLRVWCAKEAVGKALGRGISWGPQCLEVLEVDRHTGVVRVVISGRLGEELPAFAGQPIRTYTFREGDFVVAFSLLETTA